MNIKVDFSHLTIGDLRLLSDPNNTAMVIAFLDKCVVGGILERPADDLHPIAEYVIGEFVRWSNDKNESRKLLTDMLRDVKGL